MNRKSKKTIRGVLAIVVVALTLTLFSSAAFAVMDNDHDRISVATGEYTELQWRSEDENNSDYYIGDIVALNSAYYPSSMVFYVDTGTISGGNVVATPLFETGGGTAYNLQLPQSAGSFVVELSNGHRFTIYHQAPVGSPPSPSATMYAYLPAAGQFTNEGVTNGGWGDAYTSDGNLKMNTTTGVSLGYFGGYVVYKFDTNVLNSTSTLCGLDFIVYGNAFWGNSEPGCIQVAQGQNGIPADVNGDGVVWYDIAGSMHYEPSTNWNYQITYTNPTPADDDIANAGNNLGAKANVPYVDNEGGGTTETVATNDFHNHSYYPLWCNYFSPRYENGIADLSKHSSLSFVNYVQKTEAQPPH